MTRKIRRLIGIGFLFTVSSCGSFPRIVVLHDPLTPQQHLQLGVSYESQKEWASAENEYRAALAQDPDCLPALVNLGNVYAQQERYTSAEEMYLRVLQRDPNHPMGNNNLAWVYIQRGVHLTRAGELINRALVTDTNHRAFYVDTLSLLFLRLGELDQARTTAIQAEKEPGSDLPGFAEQHHVTRSKIEAAGASFRLEKQEVP